MNEYQKLVEDSRQKKINLVKSNYIRIKNLYKDVAGELKKKAGNTSRGSLTQGWLNDYRKTILNNMKQLNKQLQNDITDSMNTSAELANNVQLNFFDKINMQYGLGMDKTFSSMFSSVPNETVKELISGNFYKDGAGLSHRIWFTGNRVNGNIDYIIQKGILEKKSAYELAKDLETYVDPDAQKDWDWKKVYPNASGSVDYCAQRLARTSISHAYELTTLRSCKKNPFTTKVRWNSADSPRTCELCASRDGKIYSLDDCPMDHPNGLCTQEPILDDSIENIGSRLRDWVNGGNDSVLDNWYDKYGDYFSGNVEN